MKRLLLLLAALATACGDTTLFDPMERQPKFKPFAANPFYPIISLFQQILHAHAVPALRDWLLAAGFANVDGFGRDGEPLSQEHRRMVLVAHA